MVLSVTLLILSLEESVMFLGGVGVGVGVGGQSMFKDNSKNERATNTP